MLSNFAKFASHLLDLDLAFLSVPARTLTFVPTIAHPVLVPNADNNRSILTYIDGLCQLQKDLTLPADLSSAHVRGVVDLQRNIADRMQRLQAYINAEFNRQYHNEPPFSIGPEQYIRPYVYRVPANLNPADGGDHPACYSADSSMSIATPNDSNLQLVQIDPTSDSAHGGPAASQRPVIPLSAEAYEGSMFPLSAEAYEGSTFPPFAEAYEGSMFPPFAEGLGGSTVYRSPLFAEGLSGSTVYRSPPFAEARGGSIINQSPLFADEVHSASTISMQGVDTNVCAPNLPAQLRQPSRALGHDALSDVHKLTAAELSVLQESCKLETVFPSIPEIPSVGHAIGYFHCDLKLLLDHFTFLSMNDCCLIARSHKITVTGSICTKHDVLLLLHSHKCEQICDSIVYKFKKLSNKRHQNVISKSLAAYKELMIQINELPVSTDPAATPLVLCSHNNTSSFQCILKKHSLQELSALILSCKTETLMDWCSQSTVAPTGPTSRKASLIPPLMQQFWQHYQSYSLLDLQTLRTKAVACNSHAIVHETIVYDLLLAKYPSDFLGKIINVRLLHDFAARRAARETQADANLSGHISNLAEITRTWPPQIDQSFVIECCKEYVKATTIKPPSPCVFCGRAFLPHLLNALYSFSFELRSLPEAHPLLLLNADEPMQSSFIASFSSYCSILDGLMIHHDYVTVDDSSHCVSLSACKDCSDALKNAKVPRFSLRNNLYRGHLPPDLQDITWIEEKVCALHRVTADVIRLHNAEQDEKLPFRLKGNICAYPVKVASTAHLLPRTPVDINGNLTVVFVGRKFDKKKLPPLFRVRRLVIARFLKFLSENNPLYKNIQISDEVLAMYPEDSVLPGIDESVIVNSETSLDRISEEYASFEAHPVNLSNDAELPANLHVTGDDEERPSIIESTGVIDFDGSAVSGQSALAKAVFNLLNPRHNDDMPDLILPHGANPIVEYDNPSLMPGIFPTLFPCGSGGLEADRPTCISFQEHANYLLSLHDPIFKHHRLFLFVALNILKRRNGHLHTAFTVRKQAFQRVAPILASITAEILESTAQHLQNGGSLSQMSPEQREAWTCLQQLNIVSANQPGSPASKITDRGNMKGYMGIFNLPVVYLTLNPPTAHSPLLQVFIGDQEVDLSKRFPSMPFPEIRAKRIARDPVAAADFFVFCVKAFFKHLLGYDMDTGSNLGGILGHVKCYYGKCECTMRGCLHGHFLIWLIGALNPRQTHERLGHDEEFKNRFFAFWEEVVKHDAPLEDYVVPNEAEPRVQRPPAFDDENWDAVFQEDVKICAEKLQRHECQEVCWKYNNNVSHLPRELRPCRFLFPHEIVPESYYDAANKSIVMACRDPTMNFYNPYILSMCRHNHDIKCILSGKSAKAAMFYITNYITKDELHSHHILSMMSQTIAHMKEKDNASPVDKAKARLQRWLSQLARLQEIHAQQAVLYIRGIGDTFRSHETVTMLSLALLVQVQALFPEPQSVSLLHNNGALDDDEIEEDVSYLRRTQNGEVYTESTQIDDYLYRSDDLADISFFEFVCCFKKEKGKPKIQRLGTLPRYTLKEGHRHTTTHVLVQHQDHKLPLDLWKHPPRIVGMQVPRKDSKEYAIFMLAHFKPFSHEIPLKLAEQTYAIAFDSFEFPEWCSTIMQNWEDIHECEDERDADRLRKKQAEARTLAEINQKIANISIESYDDENGGPMIELGDTVDAHKAGEIFRYASLLKDAGWLNGSLKPVDLALSASVLGMQLPSKDKLREWTTSLKNQEMMIRLQHMNNGDVQNQMDYQSLLDKAPETILGSSFMMSTQSQVIPESIAPNKDSRSLTAEAIIQNIGQENTLNDQQWQAYLIIARKFVQDQVAKSNNKSTLPLRLLLTGPGGTGKSHVVNTFRKLMAAYGQEHCLRLLAPTGSAAGLIDATTIHKGLGINVRKKRDPRLNNGERFIASIPKKKLGELENEWKSADYIFIDEVSLLGAGLNAELDQVLKLIRKSEDWYGGANIIFAGDFAQYPPVLAQALYQPITSASGSKTNKDFLNRLGRLAWKSVNAVIELTEQKRMESDPEYGSAVGRLRIQRCTEEDVSLFNQRVVSSERNPLGVSLTPEESVTATTLVRDNNLRSYLNRLKALALVPKESLVMCAARDHDAKGNELTGEELELHLTHDFASTTKDGCLPSFIPLAVGMKVVLRQRNVSTELKIANGSMGTVISIFTRPYGQYQSVNGVLVHFPSSTVRLSGLPPSCVYLQPQSCTYRVHKAGKIAVYKRLQMLIEPAFAVTGHFAQGKTLPVVVASLKQGGSAAYVAASRPTSRHGLFLTERVTLADLNRQTMPAALQEELKRLDAIRHNTLVQYGFVQDASEVVVPDPEARLGVKIDTKMLMWDLPQDKRKHDEGDTDTLDDKITAKRQRRHISAPIATPPVSYPLPFLNWDSRNWSCAYDTLFTTLYAVFHGLSNVVCADLRTISPLMEELITGFESVMSTSPDQQIASFHKVRQSLRISLSSSHQLPLTGPALIPIDDLFYALGLQAELPLSHLIHCHDCNIVQENLMGGRSSLYYLFYTGSIQCLSISSPEAVGVQQWIKAQMHALGTATPDPLQCPSCLTDIATSQTVAAPISLPLLVFHVGGSNAPKDIQLVPSLEIEIPASHSENQFWVYSLVGVTYFAHSHFKGRFIWNDQWWEYDGMHGAPVSHGSHALSEIEPDILMSFGDALPTHYIYVLKDSSSLVPMLL